jgi:hypothetical protein
MKASFRIYGNKNPLITKLIDELNSPNGYHFDTIANTAQSKLRSSIMQAHGHQETDANFNTHKEYHKKITEAKPESPINALLDKKQSIVITENGSVFPQSHNKAKAKHIISAKEVRKQQDKVQIYYNPDVLTKTDVLAIQKTKGYITGIGDVRSDLREVASHTVVRGEVYQYFDNKGEALENPLKKVLYYTTFPCLRRGNSEFNLYTKQDGILDDTKKSELVNLFKNIILLQAEVAARNNEFIDIVTPHDYLSGLKVDEKSGINEIAKAKGWFAESIVLATQEISKNPIYKGLRGLIVHDTATGIEDKIIAAGTSINFPLIVSKGGDASAMQRALIKLGNDSISSAECIMGIALGPAGSGALCNGSFSAKEESDTRKCCFWVQLVFGSQFNQNLLDIAKYQTIGNNKALHTSSSHAEKLEKSYSKAKAELTCKHINGCDYKFKITFADEKQLSDFVESIGGIKNTPKTNFDYTSNKKCPEKDPFDERVLHFVGFKGSKTKDQTAIVLADDKQRSQFIDYFGLKIARGLELIDGKIVEVDNGNVRRNASVNCLYFNDEYFKLTQEGSKLTIEKNRHR